MDIISLALLKLAKQGGGGDASAVLRRLIAHENDELAHVSAEEDERWNNGLEIVDGQLCCLYEEDDGE